MASGRKNRGSRHRSHRHKQQKGDDSGDSDAEKNLRHGPNPNPNPSPSSPWAMEPLPPNVEGPSLLKQADMENVDSESQQGSSGKRRKESIAAVSNPASVMDRWDGGGEADEAATLALLGVTERNSNIQGDASGRKESRGESEQRVSKGKSRVTSTLGSSKGLEHTDSMIFDTNVHVFAASDMRKDSKLDGFSDNSTLNFGLVQYPSFDGSQPIKPRVSKNLTKDKELENTSSSAAMPMDVDRKHVRKGDLSQKHRKLENISGLVDASRDEYHGSLEKDFFQDSVRNVELEKELESRIRRRNEGFGDRDRWKESGKDRERTSRFQNEEQHDTEVRFKDEKTRQEKSRDDAVVKSRRERSSSRHRDDSCKQNKHLEDKGKEDGMNTGSSREAWARSDKEQEQRKRWDKARGDKSFEAKAKDEKDEDSMINKEDAKNFKFKEMGKDSKEKDGRYAESKHKENRSKDNKCRDEKDRDGRLKAEGGPSEDRRLAGESLKRDLSNQLKEEKILVGFPQDDLKWDSERLKEDKMRVKGKMEENLKDDHVKAEKHREEGITNLKSKHDRRRGELEHEDASRNKEDSTIDVGSDGRARKRGEREPDYGARYSKRYGEGSLEKRHDDKEAGEKQKIDMSMRESQHVNGKQLDQLVKYEKMHDGNDREKDAWAPSERSGREKPKDEGSRHSRRRDESQERRWGATTQDERTKTNKDPYERQKHSRDEDERQRYSAFNAGKQRGERVKDERKQVERLKDDRHDDTNIPVFERLGGSKDTNRRLDAVEKESRRASLDRTYDQFGKKNKDQDEQVKVKGPRDAGDLRENKGHASAKGDRPTSKASRSTLLQDQERIFSVSGAKDAASSENVLKRSVESEMFDPSVDRDFTRVHGRQAEELLHEKSGRKSKFEPSLSSGSGSRRPRDQSWHPGIHGDQVISFLVPDEEVRSWDPKGACQDSDDERRRLYGHERVRDTSSPRAHHGRASDDFGRVSEATQLKDSAMSKRKHESFSQSATGSIKHRRTDDVLIERSDWSHQGSQANRAPTDGPMGRSLPSNRHLGSSALLPPPPPYRPGVDNPAVMSAPGNFVEGSNARDGGRYERKTGGHSRRPEMVGPGDTWAGFGIGYPHGQGPVPGPGGLFPSFPQMGPGFLGMGQQFHGPQVFGPNGPRPMNMGFGGRFRSGDGSSCFPVHAADHGPTMGWHRYPDGNENHRPLGGLMHGWEGAGRYADDRQRFGHSDWDQFSQGITGGWDGISEAWQNQAGNAGYDAGSMHRQRDELYQARLGEDVWPGNDTGKVEPVEDNIPKSPEETVVHTASLPDKFSSKASRRFKERLQALLLHAEIDATLVDADLYKEYLSCLPSVEAKKREAVVDGHKDVATLFVDADLEFEADSDAQDLLKETSSTTILPPFTHNAYEKALKVFQKPSQHRIQKSKFGTFVLPSCISGIVRPNFNCQSILGIDVPLEGQACSSAGCTNASWLNLESAEAVNERLSGKKPHQNTAEGIAEVDDAMVVYSSEQNGNEGSYVSPGHISRPRQQGDNSIPSSADNFQVSPAPENIVMNDRVSLPEVATNSDCMDQNEVGCPIHAEAPELVEMEGLVSQIQGNLGLITRTTSLSSREREEMVESFAISEAINLDDQKDKCIQEVFLDNALSNLP